MSANHNDGIVIGAMPTANRFGTPRRALSFDGVDDSIAIPNSISLLIAHSDYSLTTWVKTTNDTNSGRIFSKGSWNCTTGFMMRLDGRQPSVCSSIQPERQPPGDHEFRGEQGLVFPVR